MSLTALSATAQESAAAAHATIDTGTLSGAAYRVDFPAKWNRSVVVFAHGYEIGAPEALDSAIVAMFLSRGYALARSAYRARGWAVKEGIEDTDALRRYVLRRYGQPHEIYITGWSMGGMIALASAEHHPKSYDGALLLCGVVSSPTHLFRERAWDMIASFAYLFPGQLDGAPGHLTPPLGDSAAWAKQAHAIDSALHAAPVTARAFGTRYGMPDSVAASQIPDLLQFYGAVLDELVHHAGGNPIDNTGTIYTGFPDDAGLNRGIHRIVGDSAAMAYLARYYTPTGHLAMATLSVHTTGDQLVPAWVENEYEERTVAAGSQRRLVTQYVIAAHHCEFTPAQIGVAFDELRAWVRGGSRPSPHLLAEGPTAPR